MPPLVYRSFAQGWVPDADPVNGPVDGLLRMDNGILDEVGAVTLRPGSAKINSVAFADTDCHSLYTAYLSGTRYRMTGATSAVYANGSSIATGFAGTATDEIAFGSFLSQILMARSSTKKKYDGSTVRNWGIAMTGGTPTVAPATPDKKVFTSCASGEAGGSWTVQEDDGTGAAYAQDFAGNANGAIVMQPDTTTLYGMFTRELTSDTDFTVLDASGVPTDESLISVYVYMTLPQNVKQISLQIAVNYVSGEDPFASDVFNFSWRQKSFYGYQTDPETSGIPISYIDFNLDPGGWIKLTAKRGWFSRPTPVNSKGWSTVRQIRVMAETTAGGAANALRFDDIRITGATAPVTGEKTWKYVYVNNGTSAYGLSAPSAASASTAMSATNAVVTAPADASRDSQVNEIWLYRYIDDAGDYYRVKQETGVSGTGSVAITDTLSDADALTVNVRLQGVTGTAETPPDNIIGMAAPYFDRVLVLTAGGQVHPSRPLNVDSFNADHAIRVTGNEETPYWIKKAIGGIYIGTSRDVFVLDGDGAELPDGTLNFTLRGLNIDNPPVMQNAVAQEGNYLVYLAADGWRAIEGAGSKSLAGMTSLLYKGYTRHGVSPVNTTTGRLRAAICKGRLVAITPEGASTSSSAVLYRHTFGAGWYRHTYGSQAWRAIHREPDGTLIASDSAGFVWTLDTGTQDGASDIAVTLWTHADDGGQPFTRKSPESLRVLADTGNVACSVGIHLDSSGSAASTKTVTHNGIAESSFDCSAIAAFKQVQYRVTVTTAAFRWASIALDVTAHPFPFIGRVPESNAGYVGEKVITGLVVRACTLGVSRTFTPYFDNVAGSTFAFTSPTNEPDTYVYQLTSTQTATDISFAVDGTIELFEWEPMVLYQLPVRVKVWENKPLVRSLVRRRFGGFNIQANTQGATVTITPVVDGVDQTTLTLLTSDLLATVKTFDAVVGRDLWCRMTSSTAFTPLAVDPIILERLPQQMKGITPANAAGTAGIKTFSGFQVRLCTLGSAVTVTPVIDGVAITADAVSVTTDADNPENQTIPFSRAREGEEISLQFDGNVELYSWSPLVSSVRPLGITAWDSGPIDLGSQDLVWVREVRLKVRAAGELTITPYFDGKAYPAITTSGIATNVDTVIPVPVGREYVGRQPRLVVTSGATFYPYWMEVTRRTTGRGSQKPVVRVPFTVEAVA